jgi:mono/diheme cytochrome c family protein
MDRTRSFTFMPAVVAALLVAPSAGTVLGQSAARSVEDGSSLFKSYCASCHGVSGRGNGAVAIFLRVPPADLTQIAKRNKGMFPADQVARTIDGRQMVKPHGDSQMPVWGDALSKSGGGSDEKTVSEKIQALVVYLESIQEKAAK